MQMTRKLGEDRKANRPGHLAEIVHAYNATHSTVTRYSLYNLMFGCRPSLPVDIFFSTLRSAEGPRQGNSAKHVDAYIATVRDCLRTTLQEALAQSIAEAQKQKWYYEWKAGTIGLKPGNLILVKADTFQEKRKIKDRF